MAGKKSKKPKAGSDAAKSKKPKREAGAADKEDKDKRPIEAIEHEEVRPKG